MRLNRTFRLSCVAMLVACWTSAAVRADVKLPAIISDHMVLQSDLEDPIWGWADPNEEVTVSIGSVSKKVTADKDGQWFVKLDKLKGPGPLTLTVKGKNTLTVNDVLVGEVWLGSGQSNMAWTVEKSQDFDKEQAAAKLPQVRMFTVAEKDVTKGGSAAEQPQYDCQGSWQVCSPETVGKFSAAAFFFGRELHQKLNVPVGLINASVGGTPIESWTSMGVLVKQPQLTELRRLWEQRIADYDEAAAMETYTRLLAEHPSKVDKALAEGKKAPAKPRKPQHPAQNKTRPAVLFNGYISPVIPYGLRGAIWYQGENNAQTIEGSELYKTQLPDMIKDWRTRWGQGNFPFAWVQLPNFRNTNAPGWPLIREAMLQSLSVPNTGMTVNIDLGDLDDIHPNKQDISHRLAMWALSEVYGDKKPWSGPLFSGSKVNGDQVEISFTHTDGGLSAKDSAELRGFTIAGIDGAWKPAKAEIKGDKVLVSSPEVKQPSAVRYSWDINPDGNLRTRATGLPASPFRTDK